MAHAPDDGLAREGRRPEIARLLWVVAIAETVTLLVLLTNLMIITHDARLAAIIGPVHGAVYLAGVLITWISGLPRLVKVAALVPVVGVWVAVVSTRRQELTRRAQAPIG